MTGILFDLPHVVQDTAQILKEVGLTAQYRIEAGDLTTADFGEACYDLAMLGITNLSKVPLRLVTAAGFISAALSLILGFFYLLYKIVFWNSFSLGVAPLVLGLFFLGSVQLLCLGIIGEYVGSIHTFVQNRPLVIEKERINFPRRSSS